MEEQRQSDLKPCRFIKIDLGGKKNKKINKAKRSLAPHPVFTSGPIREVLVTSQALLVSAGQRDLDSCLSPVSIVETALEFSFSVLLISAKTT